ncbi:MAG TPA: glycosyltransferase [Clostridia bacterium]|nr:MAG: Poly-beta-1,6-N-acetyl-D-glucosamine synthase [Firmicutes bacterium ADurb.Bin146]HOD93082.1 glycosyltransferase [Clostridia bacterium]HQM39405.1 glycosyltransferase [Clostridia bacterium]
MFVEVVRTILISIGAFYSLYLLVYATFLVISVTVGASELYKNQQMSRLHNEISHEYYFPVSIIVPGYNEEVTICDTVHSLLNLDYKLYEIIVVDDGSKDDTSKVLIEEFKMTKLRRKIKKSIRCQQEEFVYESYAYKVPVVLIRKKNGGKADALNMGINASRYPYFICMDADSMLQSDALERIVRPVLTDENLIACGGLVRIANGVILENGKVKKYGMPKKMVTAMQVLEYERSFLASRILFDMFNGSMIISGAFGLFKKDIVIAVGGYDNGTMGEDMELVVRLHVFCRKNNIPYTIKYETEAVCWSQAPESMRDLRKQRRRWHLGLFQSLSKHKQMLFSRKFGAVSFISYMYFLIFELLSPYIEIFGILSVIAMFLLGMVTTKVALTYMVISLLFGAVITLSAFFSRIHTQNIRLTKEDVWKAIWACIYENVGFRIILAFTRMTSFIGYKKKKLQWGKIKRVKLNQ